MIVFILILFHVLFLYLFIYFVSNIYFISFIYKELQYLWLSDYMQHHFDHSL